MYNFLYLNKSVISAFFFPTSDCGIITNHLHDSCIVGGPKAACVGCAGFATFSVLIEKFLDRHS